MRECGSKCRASAAPDDDGASLAAGSTQPHERWLPVFASIMYAGLRGSGVPGLLRRSRRGALILAYHNVIDRPPEFADRPLHLALEHFEEQMRWLVRHYECVPLPDLIARLRSQPSLRATASVTFDDAYAGVFEHALPVTRMLGIPITVFVVPTFVGSSRVRWWDHRGMSEHSGSVARERRLHVLAGDQVRILRDEGLPDEEAPHQLRIADWSALRAATREGVTIGAHSLTHRTLTAINSLELSYEVGGCADVLEGALGARPTCFAYPYGAWNSRVQQAVRNAGFMAAVTTMTGLNRPGCDPLALHRVNVPAGLTMAAFTNWAVGLQPTLDAG
jgi:peptidoglycan/xylan/chitin deacetylase (PgdA/CDA1 family)